MVMEIDGVSLVPVTVGIRLNITICQNSRMNTKKVVMLVQPVTVEEM